MENQTKEKPEKQLFKLPETTREFEKDFAEIQKNRVLSESALDRIRKLTIEKHQQREKAKIAQRRASSAIAKAEQTARAQERRDDTRRKIIAGALLLSMQNDPAWKQVIDDMLNSITKNADRALFGLEPLPKPEPVAEVPVEPQATEAPASPQEAEATEPEETVTTGEPEEVAEGVQQEPTQMSPGLKKWFNKP